MIAAEMILRLDQCNVEIGAQFRQRQRHQTADQAAAGDRQIILVGGTGLLRHRVALADGADRGKPV